MASPSTSQAGDLPRPCRIVGASLGGSRRDAYQVRQRLTLRPLGARSTTLANTSKRSDWRVSPSRSRGSSETPLSIPSNRATAHLERHCRSRRCRTSSSFHSTSMSHPAEADASTVGTERPSGLLCRARRMGLPEESGTVHAATSSARCRRQRRTNFSRCPRDDATD